MPLIRNETIDEYHANPAASASKLRTFRNKGPLYYSLKYIDKSAPIEDTAAMSFGRAFDTMMTEPDAFPLRYAVRPVGMDGRTKEGKAWAEAHADKELVSYADHLAMEAMAKNINAHPIAAKLIEKCEPQITIRRKPEAYSIEVQARPDWLCMEPLPANGNRKYTVDLKTTDDLGEWFNPYELDDATRAKAVHKFGYHRQAAIIRWLASEEPELREVSPYLLVSEKKFPYRCAVFAFHTSYLDVGQREVERDLSALCDCFAHDQWPGSPQEVISLEPPAWLVNKVDNEDFWNA